MQGKTREKKRKREKDRDRKRRTRRKKTLFHTLQELAAFNRCIRAHSRSYLSFNVSCMCQGLSYVCLPWHSYVYKCIVLRTMVHICPHANVCIAMRLHISAKDNHVGIYVYIHVWVYISVCLGCVCLRVSVCPFVWKATRRRSFWAVCCKAWDESKSKGKFYRIFKTCFES